MALPTSLKCPSLRPGKLIAGNSCGCCHPLSPPPSPSQIFHSDKILGDHEVSFLDIAFDEIPERYYRSLEVRGFWECPAWGPPRPLPGSQPRSVPLGPPVLQLSQDGPGAAAGGLAPAHQTHHVFLQAGDRQV